MAHGERNAVYPIETAQKRAKVHEGKEDVLMAAESQLHMSVMASVVTKML